MATNHPDRRRFLKTMAATATACMAIPREAKAFEPTAKSDRPRVGCIGLGGRGSGIAGAAGRLGDIVAVCDIDLRHAERARASFGGTATVYQDYRKLLDRKDIDVITNGTPDHWHTIINVAACRAGKDVYTEKPLTLTIDEGKVLRRVVEETGRVVQVGTQQRSERNFQTAVSLVRNGRIGALRQVWVALPHYSTKGGPFPTEPVPESLDWDVYQGQAPVHDYCRQRTHQVFRWWYEYAGGITTDWGNHHVDIAHWGMDSELTGPVSIDARGLFPNEGRENCYNTVDRFFSRMKYPNGVELLYFSALGDVRLYGAVEKPDAVAAEKIDWLFGDDVPEEVKTFNRNGIMFIGDKGRIFVNRGGLHGKPVEELAENPLPEGAWQPRPSTDHIANFFACVASREEPVSPARIQHRTISACHLTNISMRLGRKLAWDPEAERILDDPDADTWQKREQRAPYTLET